MFNIVLHRKDAINYCLNQLTGAKTMIAENLIDDEIPFLKETDTGLSALSLLEEYKVEELPLVDDGNYLGLVSEEVLLDFELIEGALKSLNIDLFKPCALFNDHIYEVIRKICDENLTTIPVLDEHQKYVGTITIRSLIHNISEIESLMTQGGIIKLEMNIHDYSLAEISRLVESNNAKITNLYITSHPDSKKLWVTFKVNTTDLSRIIQTLNRFDYQIAASFFQNPNEDDLKKRFDGFMRYLNI